MYPDCTRLSSCSSVPYSFLPSRRTHAVVDPTSGAAGLISTAIQPYQGPAALPGLPQGVAVGGVTGLSGLGPGTTLLAPGAMATAPHAPGAHPTPSAFVITKPEPMLGGAPGPVLPVGTPGMVPVSGSWALGSITGF